MRIALGNLKNLIVTLALILIAPGVMALEQQTLPFWETVQCPSENIYLEGVVRFQWHEVQAKGHTTWFFSAYWTGDAYGVESGDEYLLRGKWMEVIQNVPEEMPFMFLWNDHFQLIGKGTAPNYDFYNKVKFLINADGEVVIDLGEVETPCPTIDAGVG